MKTMLEPKDKETGDENKPLINHDPHLTTQLTALKDEAEQNGNIGGD